MTFAQRMKTVRLDPKATPSQTRRHYFDDEALSAQIAPGLDRRDRTESFMDDTKGLGAIRTTDEGLIRRSTGERLSPKQTKELIGPLVDD